MIIKGFRKVFGNLFAGRRSTVLPSRPTQPAPAVITPRDTSAPDRQWSRPTSHQTYDYAKETLKNGSLDDRTALASNQETPAEILFFMANDPSAEVRRSVAQNEATPLHADAILAKDTDDRVRLDVGTKIARLLPGLPADGTSKVTRLAYDVAQTLAQDKLPTVRALIAQQIAQLPGAPHELILALARDVDSMVSVPVLELSPLLSEADLVGLITAGISSESLAAVARRENITEAVSASIVDTGDDVAIPALLANRTAQIGVDTMEAVFASGHDRPQWHQGLVSRDDLGTALAKRIAAHASEAIVNQLIERAALRNSVFAEELRASVRERMEALEQGWSSVDPEAARAAILHRDGKLTATTMMMAASRGEETFLVHALGHKTQLDPIAIRKALRSKDAPRVAAALAWRARLGMGFAVAVQSDLLRLPQEECLKPDHMGVDFH